MQNPEIEHAVVRWEGEVLKNLSGSTSFPQFLYYGNAGGSEYLVMELLGGEDMAHLRNRARQKNPLIYLPVACFLSQQMLACIKCLHEKGFIHRDVKPANFVRRGVNSTEFCMIDFGIAKQVIYFSHILLNCNFCISQLRFLHPLL